MDLIRLAGALVLVFGLLYLLVAAAKASRQRGGGASWLSVLPAGALQRPAFLNRKNSEAAAAFTVLQKTRITPTHQVHLLAIESDRLLICTHPQGCTVLHHKIDAGAGEAFLAEVKKACS